MDMDIDGIKPNVCYAQNNFLQLNIKNISIIHKRNMHFIRCDACMQNDRGEEGGRESE